MMLKEKKNPTKIFFPNFFFLARVRTPHNTISQMSTNEKMDSDVTKALHILKSNRRLHTADQLGLPESKLETLRDVQTFVTDEGLRYLFAPYGIFDRDSLQKRLKIIWPAGISFECIQDSYKFSDFDIKAVARQPDFILLHNVLFYNPYPIKLNEHVSKFIDKEFMYTSSESICNKRKRRMPKNGR